MEELGLKVRFCLMRNRLLSGLLLGTLWLGLLPAGSFALNVDPQKGNDLSEAEIFFSNLLTTTTNPVIASMARESLRVIQGGQTEPAKAMQAQNAEQRSITEVTLLPQVDSTYVVPAVINKSVMATFLVDTGASYTVITPETAKALGVEVTEETATVPVTTANGTINAPVVTLKNVSLGGMNVKNVEAVVTSLGDTPQLSGLLGMSFFKGMEISFKQDRLIISR